MSTPPPPPHPPSQLPTLTDVTRPRVDTISQGPRDCDVVITPTSTTIVPPVTGEGPAAVVPDPALGRVGEFELVERLGGGSFGEVFLARQTSLAGRKVALKVLRARVYGDDETQALSKLDHDHIAKLYSAFADPESGAFCLCLQYVPGTTLRAVIQRLHRGGARPGSGADLLAAVEADYRGDVAFDPAALRERDAVAADDFAQAVCRVGGRMAEALAFAHAGGVLHCDVKPANILMNPYGRPVLVDFNVAFEPGRRAGTPVGGTLAYMAPEHHQAYLLRDATRVDPRCDVYSLGVVLHELATGTLPPPADHAGPAPLDAVPRELAAVIRRALDPDPARRYPTAGELASALGGAWALIAARRALPPVGRAAGFVRRHPFGGLLIAAFGPNLVATVLNVGYNLAEIDLTTAQHAAFLSLIGVYNLLVYPGCLMLGAGIVWGVFRRLPGLPRADGPAADDFRRRALNLGFWAVALGTVGWLPGAVLFPLGIDLATGPVGWGVYAHFATSFALSWLVGGVFGYLMVQAVVLRAFVPHAGNPDAYRPDRLRAEVRRVGRWFGPCVVLACAVPLTGAVLLVVLTDGTHMTLGIRILTASLIGLGMSGVMLAQWLAGRVTRLASVWEPAPAPPFGRR